MAISPINTPTTSQKQDDSGLVQKIAATEKHKQEVNASILTATAEVSVSTGNRPLAMLLKAAIEHLNEVLEPELGPNAIQAAVDEDVDVSPEATAQRIVSLSTGFFEAFKAQNPNEDEAVLLDRFMETISKGIEQGFSEAREILDGLQVLEGDIATNIDKTYDLVQEGLNEFFERMTEAFEESERATEGEE